MDLRRLFIVALGISMVRVTLPGGDQVCARHDPANLKTDSHASANHLLSRHSHSLPAGRRDHRPCDTPSQAECCRALASCTVSVALGEERQIVDASPTNAEQHVSRLDALLSRVAAPDPPPPKA